ncbi:MAG: peptidoglycan DD-metalloendopeptidase family protein [Negativicutes bacterium]
MEGQIRPEDHREYTIKIIPHQGQTIHSIRLPLRVFKYGLASLAAGAVLFVGAFGYATYSAFEVKTNAAEISELQQVNNIQQEQLSQLAKKANALQDEMEKLSQIEEELQRLSGLPPEALAAEQPVPESIGSGEAAPTEPTAEMPATEPNAVDLFGGESIAGPEHDGQGGPWIAPNVKNVRQALDNIQQRLEKSRARLEEIRAALAEKQQYVIYQQQISRMIPTGWPAGGDVSSPYGLRWGGSDFHPGIDIANDYGTPITATADGIVLVAGWNSGGYGNMVDIDHGNGIVTRYGHAQEVVVSPGQVVQRGQIIAFMGSTGFSTGPHVHYEVRIDGEPVNPAGYL